MSMRVNVTEPFIFIGRSISVYNNAMSTSHKIVLVAVHIFCGLFISAYLFYGQSLPLISSLAIAGGIMLLSLFIVIVRIGNDINRIIISSDAINDQYKSTRNRLRAIP